MASISRGKNPLAWASSMALALEPDWFKATAYHSHGFIHHDCIRMQM